MRNKKKQRTVTSPILEKVVAGAIKDGKSPVQALADYRNVHPRQQEYQDVVTIMASERVKRAIYQTNEAIKPNDLRRYILERLVLEAEEANEGGARIKALELLGALPGIDAWREVKARDSKPDVAAGELVEALAALEERLNGQGVQEAEVVETSVDTVQSEPNAPEALPWE